jgi:hypothetical protein
MCNGYCATFLIVELYLRDMEEDKVDLVWLVPRVTVLQEENAELLLIVNKFARSESLDKPDMISVLIQNSSSSILRDVQIEAACSSAVNLERIDLQLRDINPQDTIRALVSFKQRKVQICDKKVEIGDTIQIGGRLTFVEGTLPLKETNMYISLIDKQGCIVHDHVMQCRTNEEGLFQAKIEISKLQWKLRSVHFVFNIEFRLDLTLWYTDTGQTHSSKKAIIANGFVEDSIPSMGELNFNFDQLQAEIWEIMDQDEESKWRWSMVPVVRKHFERRSKILTNCEVCGKYFGIGKKRFSQCHHCGRWVGVKCDSCWDRSFIGTPIYCSICKSILDRSLNEIEKLNKSLENESSK